MDTYQIAVIPGDGIGTEVTPVALAVLDAASQATASFAISTRTFPWSCHHYVETGRMMDEDGLRTLREFHAILLGAVGLPSLAPDHVSLWGLLLPIRQEFDQYVNLRPVRLLPGIPTPLRDPGEVDILCVRENSEGEYAGVGGRAHAGTASEVVTQTTVFTRKGVERVLRYAFGLASARPRKLLASATKSNACQHSMVFWDEVCAQVASEFPDVRCTRYHVDALAARFVTNPGSLDVVVASNLFGDILTDLGGALQGSLGIPASANLNPERRAPSMFEPVHGSAPDIAGKGIANPMGAVWATSMMLDHLGQHEAAALIMAALERVAQRQEARTPDIGGHATTQEMQACLVAELMAAA